MKLYVKLVVFSISVVFAFANCWADERAINADQLEVRQEVVITETREDLEHTIADMDREIARLEIIRTEAQRKLSLLNNERQRLIDEDR